MNDFREYYEKNLDSRKVIVMNDFREFQKQYNDYLQHGLPYAEDYLCHFGILGMKWGVRRYQNPDGTLTAAGKKRYFVDRVNKYNNTPKYYDTNNNLREELFEDEYIREQSKKIKDLGQKRDQIMNEVGNAYVKEYKDFLGATNVIRNEHGIKNFNINNYNEGVKKYYNIINEDAKKAGWKNIQEKVKNQGLGNVDDLFDILHHQSKEYSDIYKKYQEANSSYIKQATALAEEMLKESGVKNPTDKQIKTVIYGLSNAYKK